MNISRLCQLFPREGGVVAGLALAAVLSVPLNARSDMGKVIAASHPAILYSGRAEGIGTDAVSFGYSGARVRLRFEGTSVGMWMDDDSRQNFVMTWIDGKPVRKLQLDAADAYYLLADGLAKGEHTVEVVRVTECHLGLIRFRGFALSEDGKAVSWGRTPERRIEFIGDSITCGYGVEVDDPVLHFEPATENFCLGYVGLTARRLDADYLVVSRSGIGMVRNYDGPQGHNDGTMPEVYPKTFYMQSGPDWDFHRFIPDVVCVNLGTNDFSTTGVDEDNYVDGYVTFGAMLLGRYPAAKLVVVMGPMNNSEAFRQALGRVVEKLEGTAAGRVHFLELTGQGPVGMGADYHPNRAQSEINARELTAYLSELMGWSVD